MLSKLLALTGLASLAALVGCMPPYSARVVNSSGVPLSVTDRHGVLVVAGKVGQTYAIEITNRTDQPVGVAISVDGLDAQSGEPAEGTAEGQKARAHYIIEANARSTVRGFRIAPTVISTFRFVDPSDALASGQGRPATLGQIEVDFLAVTHVAPRVEERGQLDDSTYVRAPAAPSLTPSPERHMFGEALVDRAVVLTEYAVAPQAPVRSRVALVYEDPRGQKLGTAGPPPVPAAPAPTVPAAREHEESPIAAEPTKPELGGKPTKPPPADKQTKPPSADKQTKPPSADKQTKPPSAGKQTKPPSAGKPTKEDQTPQKRPD